MPTKTAALQSTLSTIRCSQDEDSQHKCDAAPATPDVSFNAWVSSPNDEEDDTASSSTLGKASSSMSSADDDDFLKVLVRVKLL